MAISTEDADKRRAGKTFALSALAWVATLSLLAWTQWSGTPSEKGDRSNLPERPEECYAQIGQIGPVPFFTHERTPVAQAAYDTSLTATPVLDISLVQQVTATSTAQPETVQPEVLGKFAPAEPVRLPAATDPPIISGGTHRASSSDLSP